MHRGTMFCVLPMSRWNLLLRNLNLCLPLRCLCIAAQDSWRIVELHRAFIHWGMKALSDDGSAGALAQYHEGY